MEYKIKEVILNSRPKEGDSRKEAVQEKTRGRKDLVLRRSWKMPRKGR